jgi:hypothetical protein
MLIIKTDQPNTLVVTVSQNSELTNPEYLFSFTHIFSKQRVTFIPIDISTHKVRYDEFYFIEGDGVGEIDFPYQGLYTYAIYEQPSGSGNLNPALATNVVENGEAQVFPSSAATMESQYDIWISGNEDNANIIFAPDEPNPASPTPTPSVTPTQTPTQTPTVTPTGTNTPTPTLTPTNTPTPSTTPACPCRDYSVSSGGLSGTANYIDCQGNPQSQFVPGFGTRTFCACQGSVSAPTLFITDLGPCATDPSDLNALWWIDFTNSGSVIDNSGFITQATDQISAVPFTAATSTGPIYDPIGYSGLSGTAQTYIAGLTNPSSQYPTPLTGFTWFGYVYDDATTQRGGTLIRAIYTPGFPFFMWSLDDTGNAPPEIWRFTINLTNSTQTLDFDFTYGSWTPIAILAYNDTSNRVLIQIYVNGVQVKSAVILSDSLINTPINYSLMFNGGVDFCTEQFFFDRRLDFSEISQMFSYLNNKY